MEGPDSHDQLRSRARNLFLALAAVAAAFVATEAADAFAGLIMGSDAIVHGLIFSPNSSATYHTSEFDFTARANSLGFRDREFSVARSSTCLLIAIGDSFTFGWGVSLEESWPKALETSLRLAGFNVDVANLGSPGSGPVDYANVAAQVVPMLRPDLVVVAVLQGDDLNQSQAGHSTGQEGPPPAPRRLLSSIAHTLYPHLTAVVRLAEDSVRNQVGGPSVHDAWISQARIILVGFSPPEKARYDRLEGIIRDAFEAGDLNPDLVLSAIRHPEYFIKNFDLERPETQALIQQMSEQFSRIQRSATSVKAGVIVASVPFGLYVSQQQFNTWQNRFGFSLDRRMLTSSSPDDAIGKAAAAAAVPFFEFTQSFREKDGAALFFELDGHFTAAGHRFYAEKLTPVVAATLQALPEGCRK